LVDLLRGLRADWSAQLTRIAFTGSFTDSNQASRSSCTIERVALTSSAKEIVQASQLGAAGMKMLGKFLGARLRRGKNLGTPDPVGESFDSAFYSARYPDVSSTDDLLLHYVHQGWKEGRDPAIWFSVKDYLAFYHDVRGAGVEPFWHYLNHGRSEGRLALPSRGDEARAAVFFSDLYGRYFPEFPAGFNSQLYMLAAGLEGTSRWIALAHFVQQGVFQPRINAVLRPGADLLVPTGDLHADKDILRALQCYILAERESLGDPSLKHKIGDCYLKLEQKSSARTAYLEAIGAGGNNYNTFLNLGLVSSDLGYFDEAVGYLQSALSLRQSDYSTLHRYRRTAAERFQADLIKANGSSLNAKDDQARQDLSDALAEYQKVIGVNDPVSAPCRRRQRELPTVAILGNDLLPQCKLYRITQKLDQLAALGVPVTFYSLADTDALARDLLEYDSLLVYRAPALPKVMDLIQSARKFGITTFYDIDDLIFEHDDYPPPRETLEDMLSPAEYAGLVTGSVLYREAMAMCDYGIASTPPLQAAMAKIVRREQCFLSRNALSHVHLAHIRQDMPHGVSRSRSKFVFFYGSGTRTHNENFALIAKPLAQVLQNNPDAELRIAGPLALGPEFNAVLEQVRRSPFTDISSYWGELAGADVNLAPLANNRFNDAKSEIKWMEAGMFGIPSVASPSAVYEEVISNGHDGFIARTAEDWADILQQLATDRKVGATVGSNARLKIQRDYALREGGQNLLTILTHDSGVSRKPPGAGEQSAGEQSASGKKPLVLVVNIFYPPEYVGGATRVVEQVVNDVRAASERSLAFEVLCGREYDGKPGAIERYEWDGVPVTSLSPFIDLDDVEQSVDTAISFGRLIDLLRPDIIHFHCIQRLGVSLIDVAIRKNVPFVVTVHDGWWISDHQFLVDAAGVPVWENGNWGDSRRLDTLRRALNRGRATVAVSREQARLYQERGIENVITIPNGSETLPGVTAAPDEGPVWLGLLGGLGMAKGADLLREALRRRSYSNLRFLIVDHTMLEDAVRYELWGENRVEVRGKASFANVAQLYSRLHVVLAVSVCIESFGLVAREAQRLGRWVIASKRGGMSEDVSDGVNGFIVDPACIAELIDVLDAIDANPARYRAEPPKGAKLRGREEVAADYLGLYRTILSERSELA
jgi:glycosyltransferase involved in cell wall biosynthesis